MPGSTRHLAPPTRVETTKFSAQMRGPFQGKGGFTYMMGNRARSVIYTGVTADIEKRVWQHRFGEGCGFTKEYFCTDLMWYEAHEEIETAIAREKQLKNWKREWKLALIKEMNPELKDLAADWFTSSERVFERQERDAGSSPA
jgi:putative endonuclease